MKRQDIWPRAKSHDGVVDLVIRHNGEFITVTRTLEQIDTLIRECAVAKHEVQTFERRRKRFDDGGD